MSRTKPPKTSSVPADQGFGDWLRQLRQKRGVQLRIVAAAGDMDLAVLSKVELGQRLPTEEQTAKLARFFGVKETEAQARRIVAKFHQDAEGNSAVARQAIQMLADGAGIYRVKGNT
jgi:HTH-type transcriptional regulator, competence development regulator